MPTTRKKVIKTVYKDDESDEENEDFVDSGSEAEITGEPSSSDEEVISEHSEESDQDFKSKPTSSKSKSVITQAKKPRPKPVKPKAYQVLSKFKDKALEKALSSDEEEGTQKSTFTVNDLTESDKLLPSVLDLSESDSSGDDEPSTSRVSDSQSFSFLGKNEVEHDEEMQVEYKDVWSKNLKNDSEEIARKTFQELEKHKLHLEATKASVEQYSGATSKVVGPKELDVQAMLAQGGDVSPEIKTKKLGKKKKAVVEDSDDDGEFEEVNEAKGIPQQGLQLLVDFPDGCGRKSKKVDVEMMMRRRINRVKKEYQVYMHKVHLLCWLGHGNFVSKVLNDQDIMAAVLTLVPGKECYPGDRVEIKYVEQIVTWFKDKLRLKQDKNEHKFKPKAPPLKEILLSEIKTKNVSTKKYLVFIFVSMLRAMGVQCRVMFNFVTLPLKPPHSELCSLSTKPKDDKAKDGTKTSESSQKKVQNKKASSKKPTKTVIKQLDGQCDSSSDSSDYNSEYEFDNIMQLDGNDDNVCVKKRTTRSAKNNSDNTKNNDQEEDVSPPKIRKLSLSKAKPADKTKEDNNNKNKLSPKPSEKPILKPSPRKTRSSSKTDQDEKTKPSQINQVAKPNTKGTPKETLKADALGSKSNKSDKSTISNNDAEKVATSRSRRSTSRVKETAISEVKPKVSAKPRNTALKEDESEKTEQLKSSSKQEKKPKGKEKPKEEPAANTISIKVTDETGKESVPSIYFDQSTAIPEPVKKLQLSRKRSHTTAELKTTLKSPEIKDNSKSRTKSAPGTEVEKSKYFADSKEITPNKATASRNRISKVAKTEDSQRVSHKDLIAKSKAKLSNDVTGDLVNIIKSRVNEAKSENKKLVVKGKIKPESEGDSDYLPEESVPKRRTSDDDFKPTKISPKPRSSKKLDRRVLSSDDEAVKYKTDVWCEVFVEELEQWVAVDVIKAQVHCAAELYSRATHPVNYVVGWDNNNNLKDLTRRYVPHWNTVTRKQRVEPDWWATALKPWLGPNNAKDREEDEQLDRMLLEAPLPKSIAEYKNHPLYALERHLLKFEAIYPPDAATLGFVRGQAVYARECVYVCRSRDTWLKEAKTVKLGQKPYKVVKARPKWDKLSNKVISDLPLEVFGPWQVQDYEPPTAENGVVPRNAYGNVELFKTCMLPKKTVHMKMPGLNKVAKKLNIDCAPAMVGFDFNGGYTHPVFDGFVVCEEFEDVLAEAWQMDQEEQERKETEKLETRVYGNWKRLIKGLFIRERLKHKYGFKEVPTAPDKKKAKGPRLVVKK